LSDVGNGGAPARIPAREAADEIAAVAASLEQLGDLDTARIAYRAAAEIDFGDSELQQSWGGPFNGQQKRCALFLDLIERADPQAIIETGTYRATTTKFMAEHFRRAIFTCEIVPRQFFQSQKKLAIYPQVSVVEADSRRFLEDVLAQKADGSPLFFYLDAHWQENLPLREELEIILGHRLPSIIMIDDFRVPFDEGYKFDDYGPGKVLDLSILGFLRDEQIQIFFPRTPSDHETGAKRGCVVLSTADLAPLIAPSEFLRTADWRDWMLLQCQTELSRVMEERVASESRRAELEATLAAERAAGKTRLTELEATLAALRGHQMKHEAPRLGGSRQIPLAYDTGDAEGLLRIVEEQASNLARLRRALLSAQTLAAQRLQLIQNPEGAEVGRVSEWVHSIVLEDIARIQNAINDVVERSRWRRLGQRLGLAKRLAWETSDWQTDLTEASGKSIPNRDGGAGGPSTAELLVELRRQHGLLNHLRLSRWRKLGHWLGLAIRFPWESGAWDDRLLIKPFPDERKTCRGKKARAETSRSNYTGFIGYANERFLQECRGFATDVIFDVGANTGQFAQGLRASGYQGHMISFEPFSNAHATLVVAAASDPLWDVAERCAVGASDGWAEINIAANSYSSSLLPMLDLHREAAPQSTYQGTEPCRLVTLDSYIEQTFSEPTTLFGLKMDTQGYEAEVLAGLRRHHDRVKVIVCEMSLAPLYAHGPGMSELCHVLAELGYHCVALGPEFEDPRNGELLQANGVFVKRH
jgi:FkbM family methyltransferase